MKTKLINIGLILFFVFYSCKKDIVPEPTDYPYVLTDDVTNISDSSVQFNAHIIFQGSNDFDEIGFIWGLNSRPLIDNSYITKLNYPIKSGSYKSNIDFQLFRDQKQYVRAYVKTSKYITYGNIIEFISRGGRPAVIKNIYPLSGYIKSKVAITGENFSKIKEDNKVFFGDVEAEIDSFSDNKLVVIVPKVDQDIKEQISVEVLGKKVNSNITFQIYSYWKKIASFPGTPRSWATAFAINGKGYFGTGRQTSDNSTALNDFWEYDVQSDKWTRKADFPGVKRFCAIGFSIQSAGYIGFGYFSNDLWSYNYNTDQWTKILVDITMDRGDIGSQFIINNILYITSSGGFRKFDPLKNEILNLGNSPFYELSLMAFSFKGKGYTPMMNNQGTNLLMEYDPEQNTWLSKFELQAGYLDEGITFVLGEKVYVGLGSPWGLRNEIYEFDIENNSFIKLVDYFPGDLREGFVYFIINNKAYIGSGYSYVFHIMISMNLILIKIRS
jgi:N-acetylneuraminic acid mutarotase